MKTAILILKTKHYDPSPFSRLLLYRRIMRVILELHPEVQLLLKVCQTSHDKILFWGVWMVFCLAPVEARGEM